MRLEARLRAFAAFVRKGAPRPMKMGTTPSPWRYDVGAHQSLQSANLRWLASHPSIAAISINPGIDVMG
jgi:hypothetical protein